MLRPSADSRDWYDWCVFVKESPSQLEAIQSVEYTLHPTFPNPIRRTLDRTARFALFSDGWGEFTIRIRIETTEHQTFTQNYDLQLEKDNWPRPLDKFPHGADAKRCLDLLTDPNSKFRWRKVSTIMKKLGKDASTTGNILQGLRLVGLARPASFHSIDGQELWGATERVGLSPEQYTSTA
jgi:hypothetical protein